uniref:Uncharacterized protein n=1 Tax=viral metagenome TaxID=1070528 RepID=A0A6C0CS83_9ZZZZ
MDPFDQKVIRLLETKLQEAKQLVAKQVETYSYPVEEESVKDRLPFEISKTIQYIQQEEYLRKRKALKKQGDIV